MEKLKLARDIMVTEVVSCAPEDTIEKARALMKHHLVRHLPVVDSADKLVGILSQKSLLKHTFDVANRFGMHDLPYQEKKHKVSSIMETQVKTVSPDTSLVEAGHFFLKTKHGCLPVVDEGKIVGILSSADFVKLSMCLLAER